MEDNAAKCVMVIDEALPLGLAVNTATVLAITLGHRIASLVGPDVVDGSAHVHAGITTLPIPILKAQGAVIKAIRQQAAGTKNLFVVDFSHIAQRAKTYQDYTQQMAAQTSPHIEYLGVALYGEKKAINKLTGNLPLLREGAKPFEGEKSRLSGEPMAGVDDDKGTSQRDAHLDKVAFS
jgi:hypothetical protein